MSDVEPTAAGWDAIDAALARLYPDQEPRHVGYAPGRAFGSVLQGCSAFRADDHWHYVTYGLSNIFDDDEGENEGFSGWGYELTWRVRDRSTPHHAPSWAFTMIQRLAKGASDNGILLGDGSRLNIAAPITGFPHTGGPETTLTGVLVTFDRELGEMNTPNGRVRFLQLVAVEPADLAVARPGVSEGVLERLRSVDPLLVTTVGPSS
jgi:hypothetical protein